MSEGIDPRLDASKEMFAVAWDTFVKAALEALFAANTWMEFFIVRWIVTAVAQKISSLIKDNLSLFIDITAIKFMNADAMSDYKKCTAMLAVVLKEKGKDSEEFKKVREQAAVAMSRFTRIHQ